MKTNRKASKMEDEILIIREMKLSDIDRIFEIERECFLTPWSKDSFKNEIENNKLAYYIVGIIDGNIAGYMGIWKILDEGHITNVAIAKRYRRLGLGEKLVREMIRICKLENIKNFTLEVRKNNASAISLYKKIGFLENGIRPNYYNDTGEDAIIMWKKD